MAAPFVYTRSSGNGTSQDAAIDGDLRRLRGTVKSLDDPRVIFSFDMGGLGVLHIAAAGGHPEVCKYLVEELGGDVNAPASGVGGSCKVTEFLLSKGVPVDIDCGRGTPLHQVATNEQDKTVKILLEHRADPNAIVIGIGTALMGALLHRSLKCMKLLIKGGADVNRGSSLPMTPLVFATGWGGYTNFVKFLLKAGADPNIPDAFGRLPVELAAKRDCMEEVQMLSLTSPIPSIPNWSIDGIISHAKFESAKPLDGKHLEQTKATLKSHADHAFRLKDYKLALKAYGVAIDAAPSAALYANRSLCKLLLDDGEGALSDALRCRMLRPNWAKACYRQAAAHMLLKAGTKLSTSTSTLVPSVEILALELKFQVRSDLKKVPNILRCFPNVETLHIQSEKACEEPTGKVGLKFWLEGGPIKCIRKQMKKLIFLEFRGSTNEVAFLKFIAEKARVLEKMVVVVYLSSGVDLSAILKPLTSAKWANEACKLQIYKSIYSDGSRPVYGVRLASEVSPADPFDLKDYYESLL